MAQSRDLEAPQLPFPIFRISPSVERYMLYDIDVITWLRRVHHILGVLVGTLPQIPQQNVFLGLPMELMPEEARLLAEKGLAYVVVDSNWHRDGMNASTAESRKSFMDVLARRGREAAIAAERRKLRSTEKAMRRLRLNSTPPRAMNSDDSTNATPSLDANDEESLFGSPAPVPSRNQRIQADNFQGPIWAVTPTITYPLFPLPSLNHDISLPKVSPPAFAVFKHLHGQGYYMSPGLRFGCQFMAYPGDPLRYHSHFLAWSADWDQDIDLIDLIGGGRLGTGVKKSFLIGGVQPIQPDDVKTRTFCIEWGGM